MDDKLLITSSPHIKTPLNTYKVMLNVCLALIPALIMSCFIFGPRVLLLLAVTVFSCAASEYVSRKIMKRDNTLNDFSAVVTGMILTCCYPVSLSLWIAALGGVIAIVVVKQMFGGLGNNFVNPAVTARIVLLVSFPAYMSNWTNVWSSPIPYADAVTGATPMAILNSGAEGSMPSYLQMLIGNHGGSLGETCTGLLILGGIYLIARGIISPAIPVSYIGTVALLSLVFRYDPIYEVLGGAVILGAFFMATDYVTSPLTEKGRWIFGAGCGILTVIFRFFSNMPEGVSYAIILMNIIVPHIEKITMPKPFGEKSK